MAKMRKGVKTAPKLPKPKSAGGSGGGPSGKVIATYKKGYK